MSPSVLNMGKSVAIVQSNYIPWKGYFDLINSADEFVLFDDMQFTRRDWRNRNKIKTAHGLKWLTIPVAVKGRYYQRICDTLVSDSDWGVAHWTTIRHAYGRSPFFKDYETLFEQLYLETTETCLSAINHRFITAICDLLGIKTKLSWSSDYQLVEGKTRRLVEICRQAGADEYLSGPAAGDYLEPEQFEAIDISLRYMDYSGYPEYPQLYGDFDHGVTILDLLFNVGPEAPKYMKSF